MQLLNETDLYVASSVELRIIAEANPLPDVIADRKPLEEPYPTTAVEVAVEIVSPKDSYAYLKEKCKAYQQWGFRSIYVVDPSDRSVEIWKENRLQPVDDLMDSIPVARIWSDLDRSIRRK